MQPNVIDPHQQPALVPAPQQGAYPAYQQFQQTGYPAQGQAATPVVSTMPYVAAMGHLTDAPMPTRRTSGVSMALKGAAVAVLVIVAFGGGYVVKGNLTNTAQTNATALAKQFVAAVNAGDNAKAYSLASASITGKQTEGQFADALGNLRATSPTPIDESTVFTAKTAVYTLDEDGLPPTSDGTTTGTFKLTLVKSGATNWKVDNVVVE